MSEEKKLEVRLQVVDMDLEKIPKVIERGKIREMERHLALCEEGLKELVSCKREVQVEKLEKEESLEQVKEWNEKFEENLQTAETGVGKLQEAIDRLKRVALDEERLEIMEKESERASQREKEKWVSEEKRLKLREKFNEKEVEIQQKRLESQSADNRRNVKLPKLVITKFQGTCIDWLRFWNLFENEIGKSSIDPVAKFAYLKELVCPKVRSLIDSLPFTSEGYERARNILETKFGNQSDIIAAHVKGILELPSIHNTNVVKITEFYENLACHVQAIETMGKLNTVNGYVRVTLDKLSGIRADLVRNDSNWREWRFQDLIEALRGWTERNMVTTDLGQSQKRHPVFQTKQVSGSKELKCVYCSESGHKAGDCKKVTEIGERKRILSEKRLCFNCTAGKHQAIKCMSRWVCLKCRKKHHTSICDKKEEKWDKKEIEGKKPLMMAADEMPVIYPVVVVRVEGILCRALLDTGSGSSYVSSELSRRVGKKPSKRETKTVDMMLQSTTRKIEIYELQVENVEKNFHLEVEASKVEKGVLLTLPNPRYHKLFERYEHLRGIVMNDDDKKDELPIHVILGAGAFCSIKLPEKPRIGTISEPIAEQTKLGWIIMSPGSETASHLLHARTSVTDYEDLCKLDVLGLEDNLIESQTFVHQEFKEQLTKTGEGGYETKLMWKVGHPPLQNNRNLSMIRLKSLLRRLDQNPELFSRYNKVIHDQLEVGIIEEVDKSKPASKREFYMPHREVLRENAQSTKLRIVYDASSRPTKEGPSLNECLEPGPPLQNLLWNVLIRNRFKPIALCGDIQQAFLQIKVSDSDRDALRFLWVDSQREIEEFRFTRVVFGLVQSPFILSATLQKLLEDSKCQNAEIIGEIRQALYVDDLVSGGCTDREVGKLKESVVDIFKEGAFKLHKWHSNVKELETDKTSDELTYAKQTLGTSDNQAKILGLPWEKVEDKLGVTLGHLKTSKCTKREVLKNLASIFDPLGIVSPVTLKAKIIFRKLCDAGIKWDDVVPREVEKLWRDWENNLVEQVTVPRAFNLRFEELQQVDLHAFCDASGEGTSAVVYSVVLQESGVSQGLVASKSRLARRGLTIPRLELVGAHMATNLVDNIATAISDLKINSIHGWCDSTVVLHWILGNGAYKQFVKNRVSKMKSKVHIEWKYVNTKMNPADIGSRGCLGNKLPAVWTEGPEWLTDKSKWPQQPEIKASSESEIESKPVRDILKVSIESSNSWLPWLEKFSLWKFLRLMSWVNRFIGNCRGKNVQGPLASGEIETQRKFWIRRAQSEGKDDEDFRRNKERLNLIENEEGLLVCRGRIQGEFPVYVPSGTVMSRKLVEGSHRKTLHGGISLTMADVRQDLWIPKLRQLSKRVIRKCYGCKRFHAKPFSIPRPGLLPLQRTQGTRAFQVIGTDFAGPLMYRCGKNSRKCYILLFTCSLTRAVHLELLPSQETDEFIKALKRFVSRRARPEVIYSDNAKSFVSAKKWVKKVCGNDRVNEYLGQQSISWRFNLSRAPWWGGQFERMVGMVKGCLYKCVGNSLLRWSELEEVLLEVETTLNNRPLTYLEDDIQYPALTPNMMIHGIPVKPLEEDVSEVEDVEIKKRLRYIKQRKDAAWERWTKEYVRALRERHNMIHGTKERIPEVGEVVVIKGDEKNRGKWRLGIVKELFPGKDGVVRAVKLRAGQSYLERAVQHLFPLELSCDVSQKQDMNVHAEEFRPRRDTAAIARCKIKDVTEVEEGEPEVE